MKTEWGEIEVSDAHAHLLSRPFFRALAPGADLDELGTKLGLEIPGEDATALAGRWVMELDRHGLKRSVMIASIPGDEGSAADAQRERAAGGGRAAGRFVPQGRSAPL